MIDKEGWTALHHAAIYDQPEYVKHLYERGAALEVRDSPSNNTPLHLATFNGSVKAAEALLLLGANVAATGMGGGTPLHFAARENCFPMVDLLLSHKAPLEAKLQEGGTPLHANAAMFGKGDDSISTNVLQRLLHEGADAEAIDDSKCTPLHFAARGGSLPAVKLLATRQTIKRRDLNGMSPLLLAVWFGTLQIVEHLYSISADLNAIDVDGNCALHHAVLSECDNVAKIEWLITKGANVDLQNRAGRTPLHYAAARGTEDVVNILLHANCQPQIKDAQGLDAIKFAIEQIDPSNEERILAKIKILLPICSSLSRAGDGRTGLHFAAGFGSERVLELLFTDHVFKTSTRINLADLKGQCPLHIAAVSRNVEEQSILWKMKLLMKYGADINAQDHERNTPLLLCAKEGTKEACRYLLDCRANIKARNKAGKSALHMAVARNDLEVAESIVRLLIERGATPNQKDKMGMTPSKLLLLHHNKAPEPLRALLE